MPFLTLNSISSTVRLFKIKYLLVTFGVAVLSCEGPARACSSARDEISRFCVIASNAVCDWALGGARAAGPVGIPDDGGALLLLRRQTKRTFWNFES